MKADINRYYKVVFAIMVVFNGCMSCIITSPTPSDVNLLPSLTQTEISSKQTSTPVLDKEKTPAVYPTKTIAALSIYTITPTTMIPTLTPLPTLNPIEAKKRLDELLKNNAGCYLPCFWGITPGKTTWQEAKQFLQTFTMFTGIRETSNNFLYGYFQIPFPKDMGTITHSYKIINDIVNEIKAYNGDLSPAFYLPDFLETYGQPDNISIRTFREEEQNSRPFLIDLFYAEKGILIEYSGGNIKDLGDRLQNCIEGMNSPFIYLWSPDLNLTFTEAKKEFLDTENLPQPIPLQDATGIDVNTFYNSIRNSGTVCIETPKEIWP